MADPARARKLADRIKVIVAKRLEKGIKGMLRSEVGRNITARLTPSLEFIADAIPENAKHIADLLAEAANRDSEVSALAATAQFAGDADPYLKPHDSEDEDEDSP